MAGRQGGIAIVASLMALVVAPLVMPVSVAQGPLLTLQTIGGSDVAASPGRVLALRAVLTNDGDQGTNVGFTAYTVSGWTLQIPGPLHLAPGETRIVTLGVTVGTASQSLVKFTATTSDGSQRVSVLWRVDARLRLTLHPSKPVFAPVENVNGTVMADYPDGTIAQNAAVRVIESWTPLNVVQSETRGVTDSRGIFLFDYGALDASSRLPGQHDLFAVAPASASSAGASYVVGIAQSITN